MSFKYVLMMKQCNVSGIVNRSIIRDWVYFEKNNLYSRSANSFL